MDLKPKKKKKRLFGLYNFYSQKKAKKNSVFQGTAAQTEA
jgi:hypothetical protein